MQIRQLANKLTGRATSEEDAVEANIINRLVNMASGFSQILKKMFAYDRAYNTEIWFRVTNNAEGMKIVMDETLSMTSTLPLTPSTTTNKGHRKTSGGRTNHGSI